MANGFIPVQIPDLNPDLNPFERQESVGPFTEEEFKKSEKLRLRAVAIADKLSKEEHVRRKAHRDLALWYMKLGKKEQGEKEKQILFEMVDCKDDIILYAQPEACGHVVWWKKQKYESGLACGMG